KTANDGESAEAILKASGDAPLLVLCDMWLSDNENGIDLLRRLSKLRTAPISGILISGDTSPEVSAAAKAAGYPLLHKPASPARVRAVITQFAWKIRRMSGNDGHDEDTAG